MEDGDGVVVGIGVILVAVREGVAMAVGVGRVATVHPMRNIKSVTNRYWEVFSPLRKASFCIALMIVEESGSALFKTALDWRPNY